MLMIILSVAMTGITKEEIKRMLERIYKYTQWAGLKFNPAKCGSLSMINHGVRKYYVENFPMMKNRQRTR